MTTATYKAYTIRTVGLSHYIYRPGVHPIPGDSDGYAQSLAATKRWINEDVKHQAKVGF